jgi:hypothetical protein
MISLWKLWKHLGRTPVEIHSFLTEIPREVYRSDSRPPLYLRGKNPRKGPYTLSVKLTDFTVCRHTWRKIWVNCAVLTGNSAGLRTLLSFHTENCAGHTNNRRVSSVYLPTPRHHLKALNLLAIHSADEHRMIYSFPNTTSYSTFYAFFSSFRITLWPMWLANSKRQPCFYLP